MENEKRRRWRKLPQRRCFPRVSGIIRGADNEFRLR